MFRVWVIPGFRAAFACLLIAGLGLRAQTPVPGQPADRLFGVKAIPATFSIDADGVLEDQHVGDAEIEGKLKKMVARANEVKDRKPLTAASPAAAEGTN